MGIGLEMLCRSVAKEDYVGSVVAIRMGYHGDPQIHDDFLVFRAGHVVGYVGHATTTRQD